MPLIMTIEYMIWGADLKTMLKRVESEQYYVTLEMFIADAKRMFANARTYNSPETIYYKCSTRSVSQSVTSSIHLLLDLILYAECVHWKEYAGSKLISKAKFRQRFSPRTRRFSNDQALAIRVCENEVTITISTNYCICHFNNPRKRWSSLPLRP